MAPKSKTKTGKEHPYRKLLLPEGSPFELRPSPVKGWGAFATTDISPRQVVLTEQALITIPKNFVHITARELDTKIAQLSPAQRAQIALLRVDGDRRKKYPTPIQMLAANNFTKSGSNGPNNLFSDGHSLQIIASRFNHSCSPNVTLPTSCTCPAVHFLALQRIPADTELTFCYINELEALVRAERHARLNFACRCNTCSLPPALLAESDMRRRLIRGLSFLIMGQHLIKFSDPRVAPGLIVPTEAQLRGDVDEDLVLHGETLLPGSERAVAAQAFRIPLSTRLVCCTLAIALMQKEGVLGSSLSWHVWHVMDLTRRHINDHGICVIITASRMGAEFNFAHNWYQIFKICSPIYGRVDLGDEDGNKALRKSLVDLFETLAAYDRSRG